MKPSFRTIIRRPLSTEKLSRLQGEGYDPVVAGKGEWYAFEVQKDANKESIRKAVEELFSNQKIKVRKVRTMVCRGRQSRVGTTVSRVRGWKKALVQLAEGQKINLA